MKKKNQKGFTLVELLVVIAIIGILAVVAVPALFKNINKAKVADLQADYNAFKSASLSYYTDKNEYPVTSTPAEGTEIKWDAKISEYMESVPSKSPLATTGDYKIETVTVDPKVGKDGSESLALVSTGNKISEDQAKKLQSELGTTVGLVVNGKFEEVNSSGSNIVGDNVTIGLILIKNTLAIPSK
ncbi:type II secretion system protein [Faecalimicrobium sp. JNUCC 81]